MNAAVENKNGEVEVAKYNLGELMGLHLAVPDYQRRYCWGKKQVELLLEDIGSVLEPENPKQSEQPPLFLGTVIVHKDNDLDNLVDGQQRCLTLLLVLKVLYKLAKKDHSSINGMKTLLDSKFSHSLSQQCLASNYQQIHAHFASKTDLDAVGILDSLNEKLEFVLITIRLIDQAFAFFDSQNTAGKRLSEFDLLKARHLRGVVSDASIGIGCSRIWEEYENLKLDSKYDHRLAYFLTREVVAASRHRGRGKSLDTLQLEQEFPVMTADQQTKQVQLSPYSGSYLLNPWQVNYHEELEDKFPFTFVTEFNLGAGNKLLHELDDVSQLPIQLHQPLAGGEQFFLFMAKYAELYKQLFPCDVQDSKLNEKDKGEVSPSSLLEKLLVQHRQLERSQGIGYPRLVQIWQSLIIFYVDRFGKDENFDEFVVLSDQYVFSLQLSLQPLRRDSIEIVIRDEHNLFSKLLELPSSSKTLCFISQLLEEQANNQKLNTNVHDAEKGLLIYNYINQFYWQTSSESEGHLHRANNLSRLLIKIENDRQGAKT